MMNDVRKRATVRTDTTPRAEPEFIRVTAGSVALRNGGTAASRDRRRRRAGLAELRVQSPRGS